MNEITLRPAKRRSHHRRSSFRPSALPTPPIDWASLVLNSLPQEPPKNFSDVIWNSYKDDLWKKHKPDSRILFELFRMVARDPDTSDGIKLLANILAGVCVLDGYGPTVEGLRKDERARMSTRKVASVLPFPPVWPS